MTQKSSMSCNEEVGCKAQHLIYQSVTISTGKGDGSGGGGQDGAGSWFTYMFFVTILVVTGVSATLFGAFSFYFKNKQKLDDLQALEMSDFSSDGSGAGTVIERGASSSQGPNSGDGFMDHVRNGFSSLGAVLSSLSASAASASAGGGGRFTALQSSSSHSTTAPPSSSSADTYDPPMPVATAGQSLLGKMSSSFSPLSGSNNNYEEEEDEDDVTISL